MPLSLSLWTVRRSAMAVLFAPSPPLSSLLLRKCCAAVSSSRFTVYGTHAYYMCRRALHDATVACRSLYRCPP